ncbi:ABC-F family ATP-binding cassette domain-containing protein, partial [candidate division KSB1 bacterium]|nr:ABC-F family ATP-binding cassette domain-containing protein [candidate division KSB1 bacterium]NIT71277.1 ABC-F family ATP-binding cassette domain-containing protein [candidate division KSB1 bacterium]NIU93248.1 ATP-binding cassette domain-containing protein [candidate division KSB1 bacterium]NIW69377.1 ATP-binding cassette domain-containing protein [candidate division KSB1 bacterium]NIX70957.1 ATP-binding cassette domain-containing protein [candidate division KSB1 bacterium]
PDAGISTLGARVAIDYLPQENEFDQDRTLLGAFLAKTDIEEGIGRRLLNRFGLTEDEVLRPFSEASPGERSRLIIATAMARKPNFLILDEPSNHLDLEVLTELEEALQEYGGTLLLVSHDRYFIDQVGITHTYILADGTLNPVTDYHTYEKRFMEE